MKKITKTIVAGTLAFISVIGAGAAKTEFNAVAEDPVADVITVVSPANKSVVSADNEFIADFFENYTPDYSSKFYGLGENLPMNGTKLQWTSEGAKYYIVYVDSSADFSSAEKYTTVKPELTLDYLIPNVDYFWKVKVVKDSGEQTFSRVYNFKMQAYVRSIKIDGVSNVRDLGGSVTSDGKTVKYGIVYRSAQLEGVTEKGKLQAKRLGIKTDLDLRGEFAELSPLGESVKRINYSAPWYVDEKSGNENTGLNGDPKYVQAFAEEMKTCADPANYPMIFHCSIGRDRTGTLAAMLLAVCGVERADIIREYELSWFSEIACNNEYIKISAITKLCNFIESQDGADFKEKATNFCLSIGVTQNEIESIRSILLG